MKKIFFLMTLAVSLLVSVSCEKEKTDLDTPSAQLMVKAVTSNSADLTLQTTRIAEYAYICRPAGSGEVPDKNVIFATGTAAKCSDGEQTFTVSGLEPNLKYEVHMALKVSGGGYYDDLLTASFTTGDYTEPLTLVNTAYDGFAVHVKIPQSVLDAEHVIRYNVSNLVMYNFNKMNSFMAPLDADMLEANGQRYLEQSKTITYNDANINELDENGNEILDPNGDPIYNHDPMVPGEPLIFMAGEFGWGESSVGFGEGWYVPMFDKDGWYAATGGGMGGGMLLSDSPVKEEDFWTGYFGRVDLTATAPDKLDAGFEISHTAQATKATVQIVPDKEIKQYCVLIADNATYKGQILPLIDNNEDYMQWFTTSFFASVQLGAMSFTEPVQINLSDFYYLEPETEYHVFLTGMGDEKGRTQCYTHYTLETTPKTLPAPVVEVKALPSDSPWEALFNIKAPNKDVVSAKYAANYERDWAAVLGEMSYSDVVSQGNKFTDAEVAQMNSDEGYTVSFSSRDDAVTVLAVVGMNEEETPSDVDSENSPGVASTRTIRCPDAEKVESELFADLEGDWTATYTVAKKNYATQEWEVLPDPIKTKVTIAGRVEYPETLPEDVYALYPDQTKEEVDALYEEFKKEAEEYNAKVRGQNQLICLGLTPELGPQTPYDLFVSKDYNGYDNESLFYDFGPKWNLQIAGDGTVSVPINLNRMFPASAWVDNVYWLVAMSDERYFGVGENNENIYFPAAVSDGSNTVTVKPITDNSSGKSYYPNLVYLMYNEYAYLMGENMTVSDIVLTRGWDETAPSSVSRPVKYESMPFGHMGQTVKPAVPVLRKTPVASLVPYRKVSAKVLTPELFKKSIEEYYGTYSGK